MPAPSGCMSPGRRPPPRHSSTVACSCSAWPIADDRRLVAAAHAGRPDDAHPLAEPVAQFVEQWLAAGERAAEAVAHPHRQRGRRRLVVHDDVEMGVERGDLVNLGQREAHLLGQRHEVAGVQAAEMVLQQMQMLDQQVAPPLAIAEQCLHLVERRRIDLAALRVIGARAAAPSRGGCAGRALGIEA